MILVGRAKSGCQSPDISLALASNLLENPGKSSAETLGLAVPAALGAAIPRLF
jgi:hypothetical protein